MRITHVFKETSKAAQSMNYEFNHSSKYSSLYDFYQNPSYAKQQALAHLKYDYNTNNGLHAIQVGRTFKSLQYNNDIRIVNASCHFFTTIASFTDTSTGEIYLIKETHCNTYACKMI